MHSNMTNHLDTDHSLECSAAPALTHVGWQCPVWMAVLDTLVLWGVVYCQKSCVPDNSYLLKTCCKNSDMDIVCLWKLCYTLPSDFVLKHTKPR